MKRIVLLVCILMLLSGCASQQKTYDIAATSLPVYQFTAQLCEGTDLTVTQLITESVSCLHDYSLTVNQVRALEGAKTVVISGAGLEDFMADTIAGKDTLDASKEVPLLEVCHDHSHEEHHHDHDPHIWLSPAVAIKMAENICAGLTERYPQHKNTFDANHTKLKQQLQELLDYGKSQLGQLSSRELITFHDGFAYFADCFDLTILAAVEEESGSEASAQELISLIKLAEAHSISAVFTEVNGSAAGANILSAQTGASVYTLSMSMSGEDYFTAMYHNIDTIREALR